MKLKTYKDWYQGYVPMKYKAYLRKMGRFAQWLFFAVFEFRFCAKGTLWVSCEK
jgi:hypothetical protein